MANSDISSLPAAGALDGTEPVPVVQGGDTKQTTTQDIADLASAGITGTGTAGQVALWDGTSSQTGDAGLTFDSSDPFNLTIGAPVASVGTFSNGYKVAYWDGGGTDVSYAAFGLLGGGEAFAGMMNGFDATGPTTAIFGVDGQNIGNLVKLNSGLVYLSLTDGAGFGSIAGGCLFPDTDNASDLGDPTTPLRFRTGYFGTSVVTPIIESTPVALASLGSATGVYKRAMISDGLTLGNWGDAALDGGVVVKPVWSNGVAWLNG